jgi:hypothetical protein
VGVCGCVDVDVGVGWCGCVCVCRCAGKALVSYPQATRSENTRVLTTQLISTFRPHTSLKLLMYEA